jgi:hypothetical protein
MSNKFQIAIVIFFFLNTLAYASDDFSEECERCETIRKAFKKISDEVVIEKLANVTFDEFLRKLKWKELPFSLSEKDFSDDGFKKPKKYLDTIDMVKFLKIDVKIDSEEYMSYTDEFDLPVGWYIYGCYYIFDNGNYGVILYNKKRISNWQTFMSVDLFVFSPDSELLNWSCIGGFSEEVFTSNVDSDFYGEEVQKANFIFKNDTIIVKSELSSFMGLASTPPDTQVTHSKKSYIVNDQGKLTPIKDK